MAERSGGLCWCSAGLCWGTERVIFGSEGLYRVQWGYVVSIQHVDLPPCGAGSAVKSELNTVRLVLRCVIFCCF